MSGSLFKGRDGIDLLWSKRDRTWRDIILSNVTQTWQEPGDRPELQKVVILSKVSNNYDRNSFDLSDETVRLDLWHVEE